MQLLATEVRQPTETGRTELRNIIQELKTDDEELQFKPLDLETVKVVCFSDAGFASNIEDYRSQMGYIVAMVDGKNNANIVAFASKKGRRVTRSVLASELFALVEGYDVAQSLASQIGEVLGRQVNVHCDVDSRTLFNVLTRLGSVSEKRLMPEVADVREEHLGKRLQLYWAPSSETCADPFAKRKGKCEALEKLLQGVLISTQTLGSSTYGDSKMGIRTRDDVE